MYAHESGKVIKLPSKSFDRNQQENLPVWYQVRKLYVRLICVSVAVVRSRGKLGYEPPCVLGLRCRFLMFLGKLFSTRVLLVPLSGAVDFSCLVSKARIGYIWTFSMKPGFSALFMVYFLEKKNLWNYLVIFSKFFPTKIIGSSHMVHMDVNCAWWVNI